MKRRIIKFDQRCKLTANIEGASTQTGTPTPTSPIDVIPLQTDPTTGTNISSFNLHGIGDYKDIYNYSTKKITRYIGIYILDGSETWNIGSSAGLDRFHWDVGPSGIADGAAMKCSHYKNGSGEDYTISGGNSWKLQLTDLRFSTPDELKTWLAAQYAAGTPVIVYYQLATPIEESTDPLTVQSAIMHCKSNGLPSGYTPLQYIEANGTQYGETNITPTDSTRIICNISFNTYSSTNMAYGLSAGWCNCLFRQTDGEIRSRSNDTGIDRYYENSEVDTFYLIDRMYSAGTINGVEMPYKSNAGNVRGGTIRLFQRMYPDGVTIQYGSGKMKSFIIYESSTLLLNLVPAKRNSDNKAGMYDLVSGSFIVSSGSDDFIAGPVYNETATSLIKTNS